MGTNLKLISAVLHIGKPIIEVIAEDADGHRRRIEYTWMSKDSSDVPPTDWIEAIKAEIEYQRGEDYAEASGRKIMF